MASGRHRNSNQPARYAPIVDSRWTCPACSSSNPEIYGICRDCGQAVRPTQNPQPDTQALGLLNPKRQQGKNHIAQGLGMIVGGGVLIRFVFGGLRVGRHLSLARGGGWLLPGGFGAVIILLGLLWFWMGAHEFFCSFKKKDSGPNDLALGDNNKGT